MEIAATLASSHAFAVNLPIQGNASPLVSPVLPIKGSTSFSSQDQPVRRMDVIETEQGSGDRRPETGSHVIDFPLRR